MVKDGEWRVASCEWRMVKDRERRAASGEKDSE
jgi:hypothetical protein